MSRWETVKEILSSVLRGRENALSVKGETKLHARAFFKMAYWRNSDYLETMVALIKEGYEIVEWTVHSAYDGVMVEFLILDKKSTGPEDLAELEKAGVIVDPRKKEREILVAEGVVEEVTAEGIIGGTWISPPDRYLKLTPDQLKELEK